MRQEFPARVKVAAFERAKGHCENCGGRLTTGKIRYEHINPDGLTGAPTLENCGVYCATCWRVKTYTYDIPAIAKAKRRERANIGAKARKGRPLPGTRASGIRKRMNGKVEKWRS